MSNSPSKPGDKFRDALQPYLTEASIYDGDDTFFEQLQRLPPGVRVLIAATWLHAQVCNGGFHYFFTNYTGVLAPEALAAFRTLNLNEVAAVVEEAMSFFGTPYPRELDVRIAMLDSIPAETAAARDPFTTLDERFYGLLPENHFELTADAYAETNVA